jgi:hypothetical protein
VSGKETRVMTTHETINRAIIDHYAVTGWSAAILEAIRREAGEAALALIREISSLAALPRNPVERSRPFLFLRRGSFQKRRAYEIFGTTSLLPVSPVEYRPFTG